MSTPVIAKNFRVALIQLGDIGSDKSINLLQAQSKIREAIKGAGEKKVDMVVLPVSTLSLLSLPKQQDAGRKWGSEFTGENKLSRSLNLLYVF